MLMVMTYLELGCHDILFDDVELISITAFLAFVERDTVFVFPHPTLPWWLDE